MANPLSKRYKRDLIDEAGKYLVIFILMVLSISLLSGFLVADVSMMKAYNDSFEKYNIEDGKFIVSKKLNVAQINTLEENDLKIYENFFYTLKSKNNQIRVFKNRKEINRVCLMSGAFPMSINEIALDRLYARNNGIQLGDTINTDKGDLLVTGTVSLSDYSALFESNDDIMFDSTNFGVGIISDEMFHSLNDLTYNYAFKYNEKILDDIQAKEKSDEFVKVLNREIKLQSYIPTYLNRAIQFTGTDMSSDKGMMEMLFYIIIVIMSFVFAITTTATIRKEMAVIGTLLASGYTKKELIIHYMTLPLLVTIVSAIIGNILGYTYFKYVCANLYYNSYSLPTYETIFSLEAFVKTTLIPMVMMIVINLFILINKLNMPILNFLRRQYSNKKNNSVLPLSKKIPFFDRYRLRIFFQNIPSFVTLLIGIIFANLLILFGLDFPDILDKYEIEMKEKPLAPYITILSLPDSIYRDDHKLENSFELMEFFNGVQSDNDTAEKFSAYSLASLDDESTGYKSEKITIYGIIDDSKYIDAEFDDHQIYVSSAYADKFEIQKGDHIILKEEYEDKLYEFEIDGTVDYMGALCVFMPMRDLNEVFDLGKDTFVGYFSKTEIDDIDDKYVGTIIDEIALTKLSRQMKISFGGFMDMVVYFSVVIYVVLIYVLSKTIIDNNSQSISMNKIMGYSNIEIGSLYIMTMTIVFILCLFISLPIEIFLLKKLFRYMLTIRMSGWFAIAISRKVIIKTLIIAMISYFIISVFELRRINKVPMDQALKNVE